MSLGRGAVSLGAALAVVLAGSVLAIAEAVDNPPPGRVLRDAQRFTARGASFYFGAQITIDAPTGQAGQHLVSHRQGGGLDVVGRGSDYVMTEGSATTEYVVAPAFGLLVRGAGDPRAVQQVKWSRYQSLADFDRKLATATAGAHGLDTAALQAVLLTDSLSNPDVIRGLLATSSHPTRAGRSARRLHVSFDPLTALTEGGPAATAADGDLVADSQGRLLSLDVTVHAAGATYVASYTFHGWNEPIPVPVPAASDISG